MNALRSLNFQVMAAGDSFNDTGMLQAAHAGFFIHAPAHIGAQFPQFPQTHGYAELRGLIDEAGLRLAAG